MLVAGLIGIMSSYAVGQVQKGKIINNSYHDLTVKHSTQLALGKQTVFSKITNTQNASSIGVVYTISFVSGGTRSLVLTVEPGSMHNENLGEINTFSVAVIKLPNDKQIDRAWIVDNSVISEVVRIDKENLVSSLVKSSNFKSSSQSTMPSSEITEEISDQQTRDILYIFFDKGKVQSMVLTKEDKVFAKMLLTELLEYSCQLSIYEGINIYNAYSTSLRNLITSILSSYLKNCPATIKDKYKRTFRDTIALKYKSIFEERVGVIEY